MVDGNRSNSTADAFSTLSNGAWHLNHEYYPWYRAISLRDREKRTLGTG